MDSIWILTLASLGAGFVIAIGFICILAGLLKHYAYDEDSDR